MEQIFLKGCKWGFSAKACPQTSKNKNDAISSEKNFISSGWTV